MFWLCQPLLTAYISMEMVMVSEEGWLVSQHHIRVWCRPVLPPDPFLHLLGCTWVSRLLMDMITVHVIIQLLLVQVVVIDVATFSCILESLQQWEVGILLSIQICSECLLWEHSIIVLSVVTKNDMRSYHQCIICLHFESADELVICTGDCNDWNSILGDHFCG